MECSTQNLIEAALYRALWTPSPVLEVPGGPVGRQAEQTVSGSRLSKALPGEMALGPDLHRCAGGDGRVWEGCAGRREWQEEELALGNALSLEAHWPTGPWEARLHLLCTGAYVPCAQAPPKCLGTDGVTSSLPSRGSLHPVEETMGPTMADT